MLPKMDMCGSIDDLYRNLCQQFEYGYCNDGEKYTGKKLDKDNYEHYKTLSPIDFMKHKVGTCFDFARFEFEYIVKYLYNSSEEISDLKLWYIECVQGPYRPCHTWVSYRRHGELQALEVSWYKHRGIHTYKTEDDMLDDYAKRHCKSKDYVILKIGPRGFGDRTNGLTAPEFMDLMWKTGRVVRRKGDINRPEQLEENVKETVSEYVYNVKYLRAYKSHLSEIAVALLLQENKECYDSIRQIFG